MPRGSARDRAARAEARRRARLAARGELDGEEYAEENEPAPDGDAAQHKGTGLLQRFFPPAPPLPNRPDPLAGFDHEGPLTPVRERVFLLRRNVTAWILPGIAASLGFYASAVYRGTAFELLGTFLLFGALIAAGWFGWQRPSLFGACAALLAFALTAGVIVVNFALRGSAELISDAVGGGAQLAVEALYLVALGFLGGWYGGYLRRRQADVARQARSRRARRR